MINDNKTITVTLKERNFISAVLDQLSAYGTVSVDELRVFKYSMRDIGKLRDKIIYGIEC